MKYIGTLIGIILTGSSLQAQTLRVGNQVDNYLANPVASGLLGPVKIEVVN